MKYIRTGLLKRFSILTLLIVPAFANAQDSTEAVTPATTTKEYIRHTFENSVAINNQTVENNNAKSLEFMIQHRFGLAKDGKDLFGIYAPANIRIGLTYGITDRISLGAGITKDNMVYDFQAKVILLRQGKNSGSPVSVTYYGDLGMSTLDEENFINQENEYVKANRLSYFNEIIIGRKINSKISFQVAGTYSHFNIIDSAYGQHDFYGVSFVGRYKFSPQSSVMLEGDYLLNISNVEEAVKPQPNIGIGYEVSTGSHQFQVFFCAAQGILNQNYRVYNQNDPGNWDFLIGFNITRDWSFK